jgi:hypothetical protein
MLDILTTGLVVYATGKTSTQDGNNWVEIYPPQAPWTGWISATDCTQVADPARPDLDPESFVRECLIAERIFNNLTSTAPNLVVADYLLARAFIETKITNAGSRIQGSDAVGPLQVSSAEWNSFLQNGDKTMTAGYTAADRNYPNVQVYGAAYRMHADGSAIAAVKTPQGAASPYKPTFLDVFIAYILNDVNAACAVADAANASPTQPLDQVLKTKLTPDQTNAVFAARSQFTGTAAQPASIADFISATRSALDNGLQVAFSKIQQYAPDQVPNSGLNSTAADQPYQRAPNPVPAGTAHLNFPKAGVPQANWTYGDMIVDRFEKAGLSRNQQIAAVANAIGESDLNPKATAGGGEHSYGLFQCNITNGLGKGYTMEQLFDPETNIAIIIQEAKKYADFTNAASVPSAVAAFVKWVERPADTAGDTSKRNSIAQNLMS